MKKIAIFASGSGTNAENIATFYSSKSHAKVQMVLTNNKNAGVIERMKPFGIPVLYYSNVDFREGSPIVSILQENDIDFIVLAGFMNMISTPVLTAYPNRIINIHPALLPKYGGKGMYGMYVHEAVVKTGEQNSGITIHHVNEHYDEGQIIFQATCPVLPEDTPDELAQRIHQLEYEHFPQVIDDCLTQLP